jgi:hypothetical protein
MPASWRPAFTSYLDDDGDGIASRWGVGPYRLKIFRRLFQAKNDRFVGSPTTGHANLLAVFQHWTGRALRRHARTNVFTERHEQCVDFYVVASR